MLLKFLSFSISFATFVVVSLIFLPIIAIANYGTEWYIKWWEKITSF